MLAKSNWTATLMINLLANPSPSYRGLACSGQARARALTDAHVVAVARPVGGIEELDGPTLLARRIMSAMAGGDIIIGNAA